MNCDALRMAIRPRVFSDHAATICPVKNTTSGDRTEFLRACGPLRRYQKVDQQAVTICVPKAEPTGRANRAAFALPEPSFQNFIMTKVHNYEIT